MGFRIRVRVARAKSGRSPRSAAARAASGSEASQTHDSFSELGRGPFCGCPHNKSRTDCIRAFDFLKPAHGSWPKLQFQKWGNVSSDAYNKLNRHAGTSTVAVKNQMSRKKAWVTKTPCHRYNLLVTIALNCKPCRPRLLPQGRNGLGAASRRFNKMFYVMRMQSGCTYQLILNQDVARGSNIIPA